MCSLIYIGFLFLMPATTNTEITNRNTGRIFYSEISNLFQYLNPFSNMGCLTVVDNRANIKITPISCPIILRTPFHPSWSGPLSRCVECGN